MTDDIHSMMGEKDISGSVADCGAVLAKLEDEYRQFYENDAPDIY